MSILNEVGHNAIVMVLTIFVVFFIFIIVFIIGWYWIIPHIHIGEIYLLDILKR